MRPFFVLRDQLALRHSPALAAVLRAVHRLPLPLRLGPGPVISAQLETHGLDPNALAICETPFFTARALLKPLGVGGGDELLDLGCGNGNVLLAAIACGARARGVEIDAERVAWVAGPLASVGVVVEQGDARTAAMGSATHVFLAWTTWPRATRDAVAERLRLSATAAIVITLTWPVGAGFRLLSTQRVWTSWGRADVLVQRRDEDE